jgi:hypothetical protein
MQMEALTKRAGMHHAEEGAPMAEDKKTGADSEGAGDEHRRQHRRRTLKQAQVVLSDWSTINCTIRDVSETGARLEFSGAVSLPDEFRVLFMTEKEIVPAERLWQRGLSAGVAFTGPRQPAPHR